MKAEAYDAKQFYDEEAAAYDARRLRGAVDSYCNCHQLQLLQNALPSCQNGAVLEVAAGTGRVTGRLLDMFEQVVVSDISDKMLAKLLLKLSTHPRVDHLEVVTEDCKKSGFENERFECIVCMNSVSHIPEPENLFKEVKRLLKPGGSFVFNVPNTLSPYFPFGLYVNLRKKSVRRSVYTRWFSRASILRLLESVGLRMESIYSHLHVPFFLPEQLLPLVKASDKIFEHPLFASLGTNLIVSAVRPEVNAPHFRRGTGSATCFHQAQSRDVRRFCAVIGGSGQSKRTSQCI